MVVARPYNYEDKDQYKCIRPFILLEMSDKT